MDLTKIRQVASVLALLARSLGFCWGGCTCSRPLACTCVGFACVFGRRESRVVTVVTHDKFSRIKLTSKKLSYNGFISKTRGSCPVLSSAGQCYQPKKF